MSRRFECAYQVCVACSWCGIQADVGRGPYLVLWLLLCWLLEDSEDVTGIQQRGQRGGRIVGKLAGAAAASGQCEDGKATRHDARPIEPGKHPTSVCPGSTPV